MVRLFLKQLIFIFVIAQFGLAVNSVQASTPTESMKKTIDEILTVLRDKTLDVDVKKNKITESVENRFNYKMMSQRTLGRDWKTASKEQKKTFIDLYSQMLARTYLKNIENFSNEKVEFKGETIKRDVFAVVETEIVSSTKSIPVVYRLRKSGEDWMVYDVVIEGISLIKNFKGSYGSIIDKEGINGLISKMKEKIKEMEAEKQAA
ncbi:MAG: ABC transporter substrate-binding protein [Pseudomonadota bacterium]